MKTREEKASLTLQGSVISSPVSSPSVESAVVVWVVASEHDALLVALLEGVKSLWRVGDVWKRVSWVLYACAGQGKVAYADDGDVVGLLSKIPLDEGVVGTVGKDVVLINVDKEGKLSSRSRKGSRQREREI
jgi:hypothetical protein